MTEHVEYPGRDLEAMSFAVNYHKWILAEFRPFLGKRLVEVGAGTGSFSELLLGEDIAALTLIEPSAMYEKLSSAGLASHSAVDLHLEHNTFSQVSKMVAERDRPDSIIYVNVLEHIEDDREELRNIYVALRPGGRLFVFVPALMSLYGGFDKKIGHFRRYSLPELETKCKEAGFAIRLSKYFDLAGVIPWWIKYKLFHSDSLEAGAVRWYDKVIVPVNRAVESLVRPPLGKNILLVAEK